jgi:hypothetical protein
VRNEKALMIATMHWRRQNDENGDEEWEEVGRRLVGGYGKVGR